MGVRFAYEFWYRYGEPPWILGPRQELVSLVASGRLRPCRAIDLGCGVGDNAIHLAKAGFDVVGVDFSPTAIAQARERAAEAGVTVDFRCEDLFCLPDLGRFDLVVDYGTSDDLQLPGRARFRDVVGSLLSRDGIFLMWCFEWKLALWERVLVRLLPFGRMAMAPGEVNALYGPGYAVERIGGAKIGAWPQAWAAYLMRRQQLGLAPVEVVDAA